MFSAAAKHHPGILATNRTIRLHGCFQPEPHTLLMVMAVTWSGHPAPRQSAGQGLSQARLQHTAHQGFVDDRRIDALQGDWATLAPRSVAVVLENPQKAAIGGADSGENYGFDMAHSISGGIRRICGVEHPPNTPLTTHHHSKFILQEARRHPNASGEFSWLLSAIALAGK